jgi:translation initiation factor eIF-2B subunit delta
MESSSLNKILNNKTHGSSEIVKLLNDYFFSIRDSNSEIIRTIKLVKSKLSHFQRVNSYLDDLHTILNKKNKKELAEFLKDFSSRESKALEKLFDKAFSSLNKFNSIITLSKSGTLISILKLWYKKNRKLKIVVCESRPLFEGRSMSEEFSKFGINVHLITDAMMGLFVDKVDVALIGADIVLKNGNVVNKVGSKSLALLCKDIIKPFYVITSKSKFSTKTKFNNKIENPAEVWDKKGKNLTINNFYFEEIDKKLITKIISI